MILSVTDSQRKILLSLVEQESYRKRIHARGVQLLPNEVEYLADLLALEGIIGFGNFEWTSPQMFAAAAAEVEKITFGLAKSKTHTDQITSKLAGHWAGRILGAAFRADGNRPHEREPDTEGEA